MANKVQISAKHLQISKANSIITIAVAAAAFVAVTCLVASRAMLQQRSYQAKVISEKELAVKTLKDNVKAVDTLVVAYKEFNGRPNNVIQGLTDGTGDRDGDNAKIILDALPSKYDFPAIATSLEKILTQQNFAIESIVGIDDEIAQSAKAESAPEVVEIPFSFSVNGGYDSINNLLQTLEYSIRPINITKLQFSASGDNSVQLNTEAKTYYQSEKKFNVSTKVVQ
jgi:hypothetical protein